MTSNKSDIHCVIENGNTQFLSNVWLSSLYDTAWVFNADNHRTVNKACAGKQTCVVHIKRKLMYSDVCFYLLKKYPWGCIQNMLCTNHQVYIFHLNQWVSLNKNIRPPQVFHWEMILGQTAYTLNSHLRCITWYEHNMGKTCMNSTQTNIVAGSSRSEYTNQKVL